MSDSSSRRNFIAASTAITSSLAAAGSNTKMNAGRVIGANDKINVAVIGAGGRGSYVSRVFKQVGEKDNPAKIVAVCDVYQKRLDANKKFHECDGSLDYREILNRSDVDAVIVATPDHWHAKIALEAMDKGKDVYLEKPMCHTIDEARMLSQTVKETKRVLQVGSQTTSGDQCTKPRRPSATV